MTIQDKIVKALDNMAEIDIKIESLALEKQKAIDSILTPEIRKMIEDINLEYAPLENAAINNRSNLENFVRKEVIGIEETVAGKALQAVFVKGKWSWDMKKIEAYLKEHPELEDMRTQGSPYVMIKKIRTSNDN